MKKNYLKISAIFAFGMLLKFQTLAQETEFPETIVTDRPDQTEAPTLVPTGWFQLELGAQREFDKVGNATLESTLSPTTLWKYGLSKRFELRLISEYASDKLKVNNQSFSTDGLSALAVGSKIAICEEDKWIPQISLITHIELPWFGNKLYRPTNIIPRYRFLFSHGLTEKLNFSYNLGMEWEDGSSASTTIYTASLAYALSDRLGMFVEGYGFFREKTSADNRLDGGFTFLINNDHQLDISSGIGLSEISPDYFISCGYSFRINAFDKEHKKKKEEKK